MTVILDADAWPPGDREEAIRTLIWETVVPIEIEHQPDPAHIRARGRITDVGSHLSICSVRSNSTTIERTPSLAHDQTNPYLFLGIQVTGSSMVIQNGREAVLRPGDLAVYDTRQPYTLINQQGIHQHFFRVPISELALPSQLLGAVTAVRLDGQRPLAHITAGHLRRLAEDVDKLSAQEAEQVAAPSLALVRALLASQLHDLPETREYLEQSLELRITQYIRAHLRDHDLSAARIAHEHHVSVRHLYRLLGRSGIVLGDWLREQRLEACRRVLADPGDTSTITSVAHQWGFADVTHFGRVFKAAYGMSPREWRRSSRASHWYMASPDAARPADDRSRSAE
jgi:AraC-like DNA-binding protein